MIHSRFTSLLAAVALAIGLVAFAPSCSSEDNKGGEGGTGGPGPGVEVCDNETDDDGNGKIDCEDSDCERTQICCPECFTQCGEAGQSACGLTEGTRAFVCSESGTCEHAGLVDEDGNPILGEALVMSKMQEINATMDYQAQQLLVLSSDRPNTTEKATCAAIMGREIDPTDPTQVNAVFAVGVQVSAEDDYIPAPAFGVPLPKEGQKLLAVVRFYGARPDTRGNMRGDIVGEGCAEFDSIPAGYYEGDESNPDRKWEVVIRLFCGGYLDRECPEPKTCVVGLCRDTRCGTCPPNYTCREWAGVPDCRKRCDPDDPDCPNLHRCDASPGEPAVCVPAE